ncbi:MAG: hypothetical protein ACXVJB_07300 [Mucilaginibacter sp.]
MLLSAHLFSIGGYILVFDYHIGRSDVQIVKEMYSDNQTTARLIQLKVPVHMPTIQDWPEFVPVTGQIQLNDCYYNYTGIKMTRDTMYLICSPNHVKDQLVKNNLIVAKGLADVPLNKKGTESAAKKVSFGYDNVYQVVNCDHKQIADLVIPTTSSEYLYSEHPYIESPGKPPDFSC